MSKVEHYRKLLGVTKQADLKDLKSVYRNHMKDWHPDKFQDKEESEKLAAEKKSKIVIEAYHFLVSIAPETIEASLEQYYQTLDTASIEDFEYKGTTLRIDFSDGHSYEYFDVPKAAYVKLVNAPAQARFVRRHISETYVYRSVNKIVAAA
ncbi:KTSC domain-containing protein [Parasediminibacterium sp. JCM 36343]|uniref:KTSC domain-containing protein n=1 Tax=Parasediminibacterium sp. JCM 36343 TaxID=3374279 RepID=UPI0039786D14